MTGARESRSPRVRLVKSNKGLLLLAQPDSRALLMGSGCGGGGRGRQGAGPRAGMCSIALSHTPNPNSQG